MGKREDALAHAGLTPNETKVYLALLETGATTTGALVERTGLHIPRVYDSLRGLMHKGLASYVLKNRRKHFEPAEPSRILDIEREKQEELERIIPQLDSLRKLATSHEAATIFKGVRGLRTVLDSILGELKRGGEYADFGVSGKFRSVMGPYWGLWQEMKKEKRIRSRVIFGENVRGGALHADYMRASRRNLARFVPRKYHCPSDTIIWKDKIAIFAWEADPPTVVVLHDEKTALGYGRIFEWMWLKAKT